MVARSKTATETIVSVKPLNFQTAVFKITGITPYVQLRFSQKAMTIMHDRHAAGSAARSNKQRNAKDFEAAFQDAMYESEEGWRGIPAAAFRNAMISACRGAGLVMTRAKLSVFIQEEGADKHDWTPLIRIVGEPQYYESACRNADGSADLRVRARWPAGWTAMLRVMYDADMITLEGVANLLSRAGLTVGVGEGRPDSKKSAGMGGRGWGLFEVDRE